MCVLNTLDLLAEDFWVYLAVDAIGSRHAVDRDTAARRRGAGVILTTVETAVFEWTGGTHPNFKKLAFACARSKCISQSPRKAFRGLSSRASTSMTLPGQLNPSPRLLLGPG